MEYRQFPAPPDLARSVECLWILRGAMAPEGQTILPDGRMELLFHFGSPPTSSKLSTQPTAVLAGQMTTALQLYPQGHVDIVGVRLRPEASGCLAPPSQLVEKFQALDAVSATWARRAREQAGNEGCDRGRIDQIVSTLRELPGLSRQPDQAISHSVRLIESAHGSGVVDAFIPDGLGARQWERRFVAACGLTPKAFARVVRLQHVVGLHQSGQWRRWADLAIESGFYDQAHLANDFRAFSGQSPDAFFKEGRGMAEFYGQYRGR